MLKTPAFARLMGFLLAAVAVGSTVPACRGSEVEPPQQSRRRVESAAAAAVRRGDDALTPLNWSPVPTPPALPTASLLGLASPRLSSGVTSRQLGGLRTRDGRLGGLGVLSPRIAPAIVLVRFPPESPRERLLYGVAVLSPRAAVAIEILREGRRRMQR